MNLKHICLLLSLMLAPFGLHAGEEGVKVYRGTSSFTSDVLCTVRDGKVYKNTSFFTSDILLRCVMSGYTKRLLRSRKMSYT